MRYALIAHGSKGLSVVQIEASSHSDIPRRYYVRRVDRQGNPKVKHARLVEQSELLHVFPSLPTPHQVDEGKRRVRAIRKLLSP